MYDNNSKGISFTAGFFMLIAFMVAGVLLASAICMPIWTGMTGKSLQDMEKGLSDPAYANVSRVLQTITAIVGFFVPAFFAAFLLNKRPMKLLGYSRDIKVSQVGLVILIMIAGLVVSGSLAYFNKDFIPVPPTWKVTFDRWENDYNEQIAAIIGLNSPIEYVLAMIIMAFLPALCEETLFRGGMQNFLTRSTKMPLLSIVIVSIIFSAVHFSWYGFLPRFFLGFLLGFIYHYSGNIWLCIAAHFLNNALAITQLYIYKVEGKPLLDKLAEHGGSLWGLIALPAVIGLLLVFKRISHGSDILTQRSTT